ncbi:MAG: nucleotidyltransferase family protein [Litoreibacter sp.]|nr:nucleotidyltransferase family protein [Litoreibacter sp.]
MISETDTKRDTAILLLASGASRRMRGRDKLLEEVRGMPLLRDRAMACLAAKCGRVIVVLPPDRPDRDKALVGLDVEIIHTMGSEFGQAHSLQVGLSQVQEAQAMVVLADLPALTPEDLKSVLTRARTSPALILRGASETGKPGHPVLFRAALFPEVLELEGDQGAQPVIKRHLSKVELVPLPDLHALHDLDTPEDWAAWRETQR